MTLQEAIKSGKEFRREIYNDFLKIRADGCICDSNNEIPVPLTIFDVLADDYTLGRGVRVFYPRLQSGEGGDE